MTVDPFTYSVAVLAIAFSADLFGIELILTALAAYVCFHARAFTIAWFEAVERFGTRMAHRKATACVAAGAAAILLRLALLPLIPIPHPVIGDEFSHLLISDTFAHGRLTNPTHPLWRSFETLQVIHQPTYNSMYFPGPGLLLFIGQALTGIPWIGILLTMGLLCGAICWALQVWMPDRWAFLGAILAALKFGLESYWINSYWGGASGALGGTLILGALPRIQKRPTVPVAITMATGVALLATSRPWEGLALCLPVVVRIVVWFIHRDSVPRTLKLSRFVVPAAICLCLAAVALGVYFKAVTGSPTLMPYVVHERMYGWPLTLPWVPINYVQHSRREFVEYISYEIGERLPFTSLDRYLRSLFMKAQADWRFFFGPALSIPLLFFGRFWRKRRLRFLFLAGAVMILVAAMEPHFPHYLCPAALVPVAIWVEGIRHLRLWRRMRAQTGLQISRAIPIVLAMVVITQAIASSAAVFVPRWTGYTSWCCSSRGTVDQPSIVKRLPPSGKHLLLVRYHGNHFFVDEWVFNDADIDSARVVWARELGGEQDRRLFAYFSDRQVWLFEPDYNPPKLSPLRDPLRQLNSMSRP